MSEQKVEIDDFDQGARLIAKTFDEGHGYTWFGLADT